MAAIECRHLTIVNPVVGRGWRDHDYPRARGPGKGYDYVLQIPQEWIPCLASRVLRAQTSRDSSHLVPLTLMTPGPSPLGIVSEYPSAQMWMAGRSSLALGERRCFSDGLGTKHDGRDALGVVSSCQIRSHTKDTAVRQSAQAFSSPPASCTFLQRCLDSEERVELAVKQPALSIHAWFLERSSD